MTWEIVEKEDGWRCVKQIASMPFHEAMACVMRGGVAKRLSGDRGYIAKHQSEPTRYFGSGSCGGFMERPYRPTPDEIVALDWIWKEPGSDV